MLPMKNNRNYLFYWLKVIRLVSSVSRLNVSALKEQLKQWQMASMNKKIKDKDPSVNDKENDQNRIMQILYFRYTLDTLKLAFIILNICYFVGLAWYTLCVIEQDYILDDPLILNPDPMYFIGYYGWTYDAISAHKTALSSAYFAFTSLSTVGFGDLTPRSDIERAFGAFLLLIGVAIFSYIMGSFIDMIDELNNFDGEYN